MLGALRRALPKWIDDLTKDLGNDLYDRMATDGDVDSAIQTLVLSALAEGIRIMPAIDPPGADETDPTIIADSKLAEQYKDFVERRLAEMKPGLRALAVELLDGLLYGHKAAEKILYYITEGEDKGKYGYLGIKCRDRNHLSFVVDAYNNVLGFLTVQPKAGVYTLGAQTILEDPRSLPNFLPRDKFVVFTWAPRNGDPRGTSIARSAYNPWWMKTQVLPEYYNYLRRFGTPSVVGKTPPDGSAGATVDKVDQSTGQKVLDSNGEPVQISAEQALSIALSDFLNGTVLAVKGGSEVDLLFSEGNGEAFLDAFEYFGKQIHQAILKTSRATKEAQHGSKADTGTAHDLLTLLVGFIKLVLEDCLNEDVIKPLIVMNFADRHDLTPTVALSKADKADKAALLTAYSAAFASGLIHESQLPGIDRELDLPERDMEQVRADKAEAAELQRVAAGVHGDVMHPANAQDGADSPTKDAAKVAA